MIESKVYDDTIYNWNFKDDVSVVSNERVKATKYGNPTFSGGIVTFGNGATNVTDYYKLKTLINLGTKYSISIRFKLDVVPTYNPRLLENAGSNYILPKTDNTFEHSSGGVAKFSWTRDTEWHTVDIVRNGTTTVFYLDNVLKTTTGSNTTAFTFNYIAGSSNLLPGKIEFIRIWNRTLTASEVANNYTGRTFKSLPYSANTLFHINSYRGVIRDMGNKVTPIVTNVSLKAIGSGIKVMGFNGVSGNVAIGNNALIGDITTMLWYTPVTYGEANEGYLISNSKYQMLGYITNSAFQISRNGFTNAAVAQNVIKLGTIIFIANTSTAAGITNIYVGNTKTAPILISSANQNAGTPVTGIASTTCIGNTINDNKTINGSIGEIRMDAAILTLAEITQFWSDTKSLYY